MTATASMTMPCLAVPTLVHVDGGCDCFRERAHPPSFPRPRSAADDEGVRPEARPAVRHLLPAARRHPSPTR